MIDPKILFVKQFLATLSARNVFTIPINNDDFKQGVQNMADYFERYKERFGPYADNLELLFLKYSTNGDYSQFTRIIESFNGRIVSLDNPHYIKANIRLEADYVQELTHNKELKIRNDDFQELIGCFRKGAGI